MRCIGVSSTRPASMLKEADWTVASLEEITPEAIGRLLEDKQWKGFEGDTPLA